MSPVKKPRSVRKVPPKKFPANNTRKILYSPGYGAGWTTWNRSSRDLAAFLLTYQPIIDFLEDGGSFADDECEMTWKNDEPVFESRYKGKPMHPLLVTLFKECQERFGKDIYLYFGGASNLKVAEVEGQVKIEEYDGFESYLVRGDDEVEWL